MNAQEHMLARALSKPLVQQSEEERLRGLLSGGRGDAAFAGLVVGDFLYDYLRIDPLVMEGIDFARAADLSDPLLFADFANRQASLMAVGEGDSLSRLQGYVAERIVAQHMAEAGHEVSFPETSNQRGYDLLVDGQPFQVKCTQSSSYIQEHLEKYPDIPVIVNAEQAERFADVPGVYVDPGLSVGTVREMTKDAIADGADILSFEVPWFALAVATAVEIRELYRFRTGLSQAVVNIATDTAGRAGGGLIGAPLVATIGSAAFGPAGSVVGALAGAVVGGFLGGRIARTGRAMLMRGESDEVRSAARALAAAAAAEMPGKLDAWRKKQEQVSQLNFKSTENQGAVEAIRNWLRKKLRDDERYFMWQQRALERIAEGTGRKDPYDLAREVVDLIGRAGIHQHKLQDEYRALAEALKKLNRRR